MRHASFGHLVGLFDCNININISICSIELKWDGNITKIWYNNEMRQSLTLLFTCLPMSQLTHLTLLVTSASYSTRYSPCQIIFPLFLNLAFCLFVTFVESEVLLILLQLKLSLHLSFIPRYTIATLYLSLSQSSSLSTWSSSIDSQLCGSCCF